MINVTCEHSQVKIFPSVPKLNYVFLCYKVNFQRFGNQPRAVGEFFDVSCWLPRLIEGAVLTCAKTSKQAFFFLSQTFWILKTGCSSVMNDN